MTLSFSVQPVVQCYSAMRIDPDALVVNLCAAKALGIRIPQSVLIQADEVIR